MRQLTSESAFVHVVEVQAQREADDVGQAVSVASSRVNGRVRNKSHCGNVCEDPYHSFLIRRRRIPRMLGVRPNE